jgi:hypothetical protein
MLVRSQICLINIEIFSLTLYIHVIITTNTFESLSTLKWVIICFLIKSIMMYMPHILAWNTSREPILQAKLLNHPFRGCFQPMKTICFGLHVCNPSKCGYACFVFILTQNMWGICHLSIFSFDNSLRDAHEQ